MFSHLCYHRAWVVEIKSLQKNTSQIMSIRAHNLEIIPSWRSLFSVYPSFGLIDDLPSIRKPLHFKTLGETLGREGHSPWGLIAGAECFLFQTARLLLTNKPFIWEPDWRSNSWGVGGCVCTHTSKCLHTQRVTESLFSRPLRSVIAGTLDPPPPRRP